ncbi:MAG: serine hydrolase [Planctomycetes bacterium]|nr:serine hydrolase [Planctomycetota bacterium]
MTTHALRGMSVFLILASCLPIPTLEAQRDSVQYAPAIAALEKWIAQEVADKKLPALSIALVDDQKLVWSRGFGHADPAAKTEATATTVYRVGSVSKPFTTLLLMILVEMGLIDLDVPVQRYLPEFQPKNPHGKAITLRQLVSHRSGLVRESPVGNYFDDTEPSIADTVKSLNSTRLVFVPESTTSYSNAALATVGHVIERVTRQPFATAMTEKLLTPLGMTDSSFDLTPELRKRLARATMWTYHGREFPAPTWAFGMSPAGNLYSTADDMAKFLSFLFARGQGAKGRILKQETLEKTWQIQFEKKGAKEGFGLGFYVSELDGKRRVGHGGAVYGFATQLSALPDDKLGVIVAASRDVSNGVTSRIADVALRHMLAVRGNKPLPPIDRTRPLDRTETRKLAGNYVNDKKAGFELRASNGKLFFMSHKGGALLELRRHGKDLMIDDPQAHGARLQHDGDALKLAGATYRRVADRKPADCPARFLGLIGEYGPDFNTLFILEKDGKLHALIEWVFLYPLREVSETVFKFPDYGLYKGDELIFTRDRSGRATHVEAASVPFKRRNIKGEMGETFTLTPLRPIAELRKSALAARPPQDNDPLMRKPELVDVATLDPSIRLDIRYAGKNNFLGTPLYSSARAFLQRPAAEALLRVHQNLEKHGYGLLLHDAYRPWFVTRIFWNATEDRYHHFVADPRQGSRHNRGCAVDLTLFDRKSGKAVAMVSGYDEFSDRAYADYIGGTSRQRWQRDLLRKAMEDEGFSVYPGEWWHFDYRDWRLYPILNLPFADVK